MSKPVYILSFRHRDDVAALAAAAGWQVVATDRADEADRGLAGSGAAVAVLDARDAGDEALAAAHALDRAVAGRGGALLALVTRGTLDGLDALRAAGVTHFLASPFADAEFAQALRFAGAAAERRGAVRDDRPTGAALDGYLARDLNRAMAADEIEILFQPQATLAGEAIVGVEALIRWRHPELGELGADALLDAADRAGLGLALSSHAQARALAIAAAWPAALADLRLSINVTADDIATADFAGTLLRRVAASGFPAGRLTVEITERGLIADPARAAGLLGELRAAGLRIAIDDFGTGYSSLAYLSQLPLDYLKLDRALTQGVTGSPRDRVVVGGIVALAHALELTVIAEGVERADQRDRLAQAGCALFQGYLCAEPLSVAALVSLRKIV